MRVSRLNRPAHAHVLPRLGCEVALAKIPRDRTSRVRRTSTLPRVGLAEILLLCCISSPTFRCRSSSALPPPLSLPRIRVTRVSAATAAEGVGAEPETPTLLSELPLPSSPGPSSHTSKATKGAGVARERRG